MATLGTSNESISGADLKTGVAVTATTIINNEKPKTRDRLLPNESLGEDESLISSNGRFEMKIQKDGKVVLCDKESENRVLWKAGLRVAPGKKSLIMRSTGNLSLVVSGASYDDWTSRTAGNINANAIFILQEDGNAVIYKDTRVVWDSKTVQPVITKPQPIPIVDKVHSMVPGDRLKSKEALVSPNGRYRLVMQPNCNLVLYDTVDANRQLWSSNTIVDNGEPVLAFDAFGNIVILNKADSGNQLWSKGGSWKDIYGTYLRLQDDGNVVLFLQNFPIWQSDMSKTPKRDCLYGGENLAPEGLLLSANGKFRLSFTSRGNIAIIEMALANRVVWGLKDDLPFNPYKFASLGKDGDFVLMNDGQRHWHSESKGAEPVVLTMQDDGNAVITSAGKQIWRAIENENFLKPGRKETRLYVGDILWKGEKLTSQNGMYYAAIENGNLVVCKQGGPVLWTTSEQTNGNAVKIRMKPDGELDIIDDYGRAIWSAGTAKKGDANSFFFLQADGSFALKSGESIIWSTVTEKEKEKRDAEQEAERKRREALPKIDRLLLGKILVRGEFLTSRNGRCKLIMQDDGKCVLYEDTRVLWTAPGNPTGNSLTLQENGNLVLDGSTWSSNTGQSVGVTVEPLVLQDDGVLVLKADGEPVWSTNWDLLPPRKVQSGGNLIKNHECLVMNRYLQSPNGQYTATLDKIGRLVVRHKSSVYALWGSDNLDTSDVQRLIMQRDGNLVILNGQDNVLWTTKTGGYSNNTTLKMQDDGNLQIVEMRAGSVPWSTKILQYPFFKSTMTHELYEGMGILRDQWLLSADTNVKLTITEDGRIEIRKSGQTRYISLAKGVSDVGSLAFLEDGILQIRNSWGGEVWRSAYHSSSVWKEYMKQKKAQMILEVKEPIWETPRFILQDDGDAIIRYQNETIWSTSPEYLKS